MSEEYSVIPWYVRRSGGKGKVGIKREKEQDALEGG
jgi:hypothetical protein